MKNNNWIWIVALIIVGLFFFKGGRNLFAIGQLPTPVDVQVKIDSLSMSSGCSGNVLFAPTATYPLQVCVGTVCQSYTSGEYGSGSTFTIPGVADTNVNVKFDWKRIKDPAGHYDHRENGASIIKNNCAVPQPSHLIVYDGCTASRGILGEYNGFNTVGDYNGCWYITSYLVGAMLPWNTYGDACYIYEGYVRTGGTNAIASDVTTTSCKHITGIYSTTFNSCIEKSGFADVYTCTPGTPASCPSGLCSYAQGSSISSAFTLDSSGTKTVTFTDKLSAQVIMTWSIAQFGLDSDSDGLTNQQELSAGTDPALADTDGDGMLDGWEVQNGLDPKVNDANSDKDSDGKTNLEEYTAGTNPSVVDIKGDYNSDGTVSMSEVMQAIGKWKAGTIPMSDLMTVINNWKGGAV